MKRMLLVLLSIALTFGGFSQGTKLEKIFVLSEVRASDDLEYEKYSYNDDMLLQAKKSLTDYGTELIDSLTYDAFNNNTKLSIYQLLNGNWTYVAYIDYTYDENGNRLTRTNYNSYGTPNFTIGGVYNYFYDEDNKLTHWELYMGGTDLMQICTLTYTADGKVVQEIGQEVVGGIPENSWKIDYLFNTDGTMNTTSQAFWNGFSWAVVSGSDWFYYDDNKNCIKWDHKNGNTVTNRNTYEYDMEYTAGQLVMPVEPESNTDVSSLVAMENKVTLRHWYTENDAGNLVYVCDYIYDYDIIEYTAVPDLGFNADNVRIFPNPASDLITITGNNTIISNIDVVDNTGKVILKEANKNKGAMNLDLTTLEPGVYYLRLLTSKGVVMEKLVVQ
jgi:hypothetical protein